MSAAEEALLVPPPWACPSPSSYSRPCPVRGPMMTAKRRVLREIAIHAPLNRATGPVLARPQVVGGKYQYLYATRGALEDGRQSPLQGVMKLDVMSGVEESWFAGPSAFCQEVRGGARSMGTPSVSWFRWRYSRC